VAKSRRYLVPAVALLVGATLAVARPAAAQAGYSLDPARNIPLTSRAFGWACTHHPLRHTCERIVVRALNHARSVLDQPSYNLPARFGALRPREQLLLLANLDRKLYHHSSISGLNPTLDASAQRGATDGGDPAFMPIGGRGLLRGGSNWAGGFHSPLAAYYMWMYDDAGSSWMHRHNVLMPVGDRDNILILGVGTSPATERSPDWTMIFEAFGPGTPITYVPTVFALSARSAASTRTNVIRLLGFGFLHVRQVTFGGVPATFTRTSLFTISAVPPPHVPGRVHVRVVTTGGTSRATAATLYTY
jgi:hypothetical protein